MTTIRDAMTEPALFGGQFAGDSWLGWRALLAGFYGLALDDAEAERFKRLTGRESVPQSAHDELWLVVGRRGGKSQCAALLAVYEAAFRDHADKLAPGEVARRAVWLESWLETQEAAAAEGEQVDIGRQVQALNALIGLWRTLGLERRQKNAPTLQEYLRQKEQSA